MHSYRPILLTLLLGGVVPIAASVLLGSFAPDWRWDNLPSHAAVEAIGSFCAFMLAAMIITMRSYGELNSSYIWLACGLMAMGVLDGAHALLPAGRLFVWTHSIATFLGGAFFALVWLPERINQQALKWGAPWIVGGLSLIGAVISSLSTTEIPAMVLTGEFTLWARNLNILGGICFLISALYFLSRQPGATDNDKTVFSTHAFLFGIAGLLFETSALWDAGWWLWHFLRLAAYLVAVHYFFKIFRTVLYDLRRQRDESASAAIERTKELEKNTERLKKKSLQFQQLSQAIEQSPHMVLITDVQGVNQYANPSFMEKTGYTIDEIIGKDPRIIKSPHTPIDVYNGLWDILLAGDVFEGEIQVRTKDGRDFWAAIKIGALKDNNGEITGFCSTHEDISDRKAAEQALKEARERAEAASQAKSDFLSNMSHEIRTPMNGIMMSLTLALTQKLPKEAVELISLASQSTDNLLHIINDILDFSKMESGKLELRHEPFSMAFLIDHTKHLIGPQAQEKNIDFIIDMHPDVPDWILGDDVRLQQVLNNLLTNALKFTRKGSITLRSDYKAINDTEGRLKLRVIDTGCGISKNGQVRLFKRFSQVRNHQADSGGTGLGLAICRQLISLMGGEIDVVSDGKTGSEFWFQIPVTKTDMKPKQAQSNAPLEDDRTLSLLVAEDVPLNQMLIKKLLAKMGHDFALVSNGQEAVERALSDEHFDLILMDNQMPIMTGLEATRKIRASTHEKATIPIIALTADALDAQKEAFQKVGMDGFVSKPIDAVRLKSEMKRVLLERQ